MSRTLRTAFSIFAIIPCFLLSGCNSSTESGGAGGLPEGSFLLQTDSDDLYRYEQYFIVRPGGMLEFAEYGYRPGNKAVLCQLSRQKYSYSVSDSTLNVKPIAGGEYLEGCGIDKAEFDAFPFESAAGAPSGAFQVRNITTTGFEGKDLFIGSSGWKTFVKTSDPYGFF